MRVLAPEPAVPPPTPPPEPNLPAPHVRFQGEAKRRSCQLKRTRRARQSVCEESTSDEIDCAYEYTATDPTSPAELAEETQK